MSHEIRAHTGDLTLSAGGKAYDVVLTEAGALTIPRALTLTGAVTLTGAPTITGDLTVTGDTGLTGALDVTGDTGLTGALDVTGDTGLTGALDVTGDPTVIGDTDLTGALDVTGDVTVIGDSDFTGAFTVTGDPVITGDVTCDTLTVVGAGGSNTATLTSLGAGILSQSDGTTAQEFQVAAEYTSGTQYHTSAIVTTRTPTTAASGATLVLSNAVPAGAFLLGVTTRIDTELGATNGTTGYTVGDGSDADMWGVASAVVAGTATASADFTAAGATSFSTSARSITITAVGGNFDGTGVITVCVHYIITTAS